jgi:hypothetical protein
MWNLKDFDSLVCLLIWRGKSHRARSLQQKCSFLKAQIRLTKLHRHASVWLLLVTQMSIRIFIGFDTNIHVPAYGVHVHSSHISPTFLVTDCHTACTGLLQGYFCDVILTILTIVTHFQEDTTRMTARKGPLSHLIDSATYIHNAEPYPRCA